MRGWNLILLAALAVTGCTSQGRSPCVIVVDRSVGCFHEEEVITRYERRGRFYVSQNRSIPVCYVEAVREIVTQTRRDRSAVLGQFNITPQTVADHFPDMVEAAQQMWPNQIPYDYRELPATFRSVFAYEAIADEVLKNGTGRTRSTTTVLFSVTLPGSPPIIVSSECEHPFMLPWTVQFGDATWETYSTDVPKALTLLADSTGPNTRLLDGTDYWAHWFWKDENVWGMAVVGLLP